MFEHFNIYESTNHRVGKLVARVLFVSAVGSIALPEGRYRWSALAAIAIVWIAALGLMTRVLPPDPSNRWWQLTRRRWSGRMGPEDRDGGRPLSSVRQPKWQRPGGSLAAAAVAEPREEPLLTAIATRTAFEREQAGTMGR